MDTGPHAVAVTRLRHVESDNRAPSCLGYSCECIMSQPFLHVCLATALFASEYHESHFPLQYARESEAPLREAIRPSKYA